ncbi:hypothetical protein Tco_0571731, partial [Tanacetum coccineum]
MAVFDLNQPVSSLTEEDDVSASNSHVLSVNSSINIGCDSFASHDDNASSSNSLKTSKAVIHHEFIDTPSGSVYWVPRVSASVLPVLGTVYDSLDECIEMYRKYASEAEDMELESINSGPNAKLPIRKLGEYEMWAIRIKQYFHIQDYAFWEVIENGDSWVSVSQTTKENRITVTKMSTPLTVEEKTKKKNDVKAI